MSKIITSNCRHILSYYKNKNLQNIVKRTFLSNAYYCHEVWNDRFKSSLLQKVNVDELYHELDSSFNKNKNISAIDVDIFANSIQNDNHADELLDVVHKLRLSSETCNTLPSTEHAVIRYLSHFDLYEKLLQILDDRLNYGIFLDSYTASLLLDTFWKKSDYTSGAKVASQLMLQENFNHSFSTFLSLLHCYKFLQNPNNWSEPPPIEEPTDEVKIRVKYIRNPFFDDHFDLKNPMQIVGKTLTMAGSQLNDSVGRTLQILGLALQNKIDKAQKYIMDNKNESVIMQALNILPDDNEIKIQAQKLKTEDLNIQEILENKCKDAERNCAEKDVSEQCAKYEHWLTLRENALEKQRKRLEIVERLSAVEKTQNKLREKEKLLWYFDNKEKIELEIEDKKVFYPKRWFGKKKIPRQVDENYVPPEVKSSYNKES